MTAGFSTSGPNYPVDRKGRFAGILENPWISKIQRGLLDSGRVRGLIRGLEGISFDRVLDIGCGFGEYCALAGKNRSYVGVDNSFTHLRFAQTRYPRHQFALAQAPALPFVDQSFDLVLLIDTAHHFSDEQFRQTLTEMRRLSRRYLVISDPFVFEGQSRLSRFFYSLDRGACFRHEKDCLQIINSIAGLSCIGKFSCRTFPGLYTHQTYILGIVPLDP